MWKQKFQYLYILVSRCYVNSRPEYRGNRLTLIKCVLGQVLELNIGYIYHYLVVGVKGHEAYNLFYTRVFFVRV